MTNPLPQPGDLPPVEQTKLFKRNDDGLIEGLTYRYTPDGRVDYLAMLDRRHLFVIDSKRDAVVKKQGKPIDECDLSLVDERWLRIKQAGFNQLLNLRGYSRLEYHSLVVDQGKAAVVCTIELIPNYETNHYPVICSAIASASVQSMDRNFVPYLETFAENRSFARCVKRALQIAVLSDDEIDAEAVRGVKGDAESTTDTAARPVSAEPYATLQDLCIKRKTPITFEALRARAIRHNAELPPDREDERIKSDPALWIDWSSVQPVDAWLLTGKIKEADEAAAKGAKGRK